MSICSLTVLLVTNYSSYPYRIPPYCAEWQMIHQRHLISLVLIWLFNPVSAECQNQRRYCLPHLEVTPTVKWRPRFVMFLFCLYSLSIIFECVSKNVRSPAQPLTLSYKSCVFTMFGETLEFEKCLSLFFQAKRKKSSAPPEKPAKKPKSGESSKPGGSSKASSNGDDNMFQVGSRRCPVVSLGSFSHY